MERGERLSVGRVRKVAFREQAGGGVAGNLQRERGQDGNGCLAQSKVSSGKYEDGRTSYGGGFSWPIGRRMFMGGNPSQSLFSAVKNSRPRPQQAHSHSRGAVKELEIYEQRGPRAVQLPNVSLIAKNNQVFKMEKF